MTDGLQIWTVFDHPLDFPDCYVARLSIVNSSGVAVQSVALRSENLDELREALAAQGLARLDRDPSDDAKIVEVWL